MSRFELRVFVRKQTIPIDSYDTIREAREIAKKGEFEYYTIWDNLEKRTLIQYGEQESG